MFFRTIMEVKTVFAPISNTQKKTAKYISLFQKIKKQTWIILTQMPEKADKTKILIGKQLYVQIKQVVSFQNFHVTLLISSNRIHLDTRNSECPHAGLLWLNVISFYGNQKRKYIPFICKLEQHCMWKPWCIFFSLRDDPQAGIKILF